MSNQGINNLRVAAKNRREVFSLFWVALVQRQQLLVAVVEQGFDDRVVGFREAGDLHSCYALRKVLTRIYPDRHSGSKAGRSRVNNPVFGSVLGRSPRSQYQDRWSPMGQLRRTHAPIKEGLAIELYLAVRNWRSAPSEPVAPLSKKPESIFLWLFKI